MSNDSRITARQLPNWETPCKVTRFCVYRDTFGNCDEPRVNKGNSDSACHQMNNKDLLEVLEPRP